MTLDTLCPSCGQKKVQEFTRIEKVPVHNSLVLKDRQAARTFPRGNVALGLCAHCGFITNMAFDPALIHYDQQYEDQQSFSPTFNTFARSLASHLIERYALRGKSVLEIGCGKGDFLALLCELGVGEGIGIDPTALPERLKGPGSERITFVRDLYSEKYADYEADLICCRHTLEHIPDTAAFLRTIRRAIGRRSTPLFIEVPDALRVLSECAYWDVYYEHCSYFTPHSLSRLVQACGFEVIDCRLAFDDQYILLEARPGAMKDASDANVEDLRSAAQTYARTLDQMLAERRAWLAERKQSGERVVVWGSGSKCVAFLTTLGLENPGVRVVDINPHRHGKFLLGSGIEIESPHALAQEPPDHVIVMNPVYLGEIRTMLENMDIRCNLMAV